MEDEIQHLIDQDIIEKVSEPTGWVSLPVVMPKKDQSQICLNVDMCVANQAIPRRHTQHPTIDDVVNELSGSTVFSHLDMSKGYHQLELKESSRNVTTFSTHIGLYRYKRLNYGTRSVAETWVLGPAQKGNKIHEGHCIQRLHLRIAHICSSTTSYVLLAKYSLCSWFIYFFLLLLLSFVPLHFICVMRGEM